MKKVYIISFIFGVVLMAQAATENLNLPETSVCTGGACSLDKIKSNSIFEGKPKILPHIDSQPNVNPASIKPFSSDGLSGSDYSYDSNCQFGNCINNSTGY